MPKVLHLRNPNEQGRSSTSLELFFDLVSVVAITSAASLLHHGLSSGHSMHAIGTFLIAFWGIWWSWMNFTWFANSYDSDGPIYRIAVFIQIIGALVMAAGIKQIFEHFNFAIGFLGFAIMRISLISMWLRAAHGNHEQVLVAKRMAIGILFCQLGWGLVIFSFSTPYLIYGIVLLVTAEHLVPILAGRNTPAHWHRDHIIERYGLLTIIVLGESILSSYLGIQTLFDGFNPQLFINVVGGILILFSMWWLYFDEENFHILNTSKGIFKWGYGHFIIFSSIAAVGTGLAFLTEQITEQESVNLISACYSVAIPISVYLLTLLMLHRIPSQNSTPMIYIYLVTVLLIMISPLLVDNILIIGTLLCLLVYVHEKLNKNEVILSTSINNQSL